MANQLNSKIHFSSQDSRFQNRSQLDKSDQMEIEAILDGTESLKFQVENITSFGALVSLPISILGTDLNSKRLKNIRILLNTSLVGEYPEAEVVHSKSTADKTTFGLRFLSASNTPQPQIAPDKRAQFRISPAANFLPYALTQHPFIYEDTIHFKVADLSIGGARLTCSLRNNLILKGATFEPLEIFLPTIGSIHVKAQVVFINQISDEEVSIGIKFKELSTEQKSKISKFIVAFCPTLNSNPISNLKNAGFKPKLVKSHITYHPVSNTKEYEEVLSLRKEAYSRAKKVDAAISASEMADIFDLNSMIIVAKHQGKVIGSVRVTFCRKEEDRFELDSSIQVPDWIPRGQTIEVSRLCVSTEFQGTDMVLGLIERCVEIAAKTGAKYAISSCVDEMIEYYKKLGFFTTGLTFTLKTLNDIPHYFLIHNTESSYFSARMNPIFWHFSYSKMAEHLRRFNFLKKDISSLRRFQIWIGLKLLNLRTKRKSKSKSKSKSESVQSKT